MILKSTAKLPYSYNSLSQSISSLFKHNTETSKSNHPKNQNSPKEGFKDKLPTKTMPNHFSYPLTRRFSRRRLLPGPEPFYDWNFGGIYSVLRDMYTWLDYNRYHEEKLRKAVGKGLYRYFECTRCNERKETLCELSNTVHEEVEDRVEPALEKAQGLLKYVARLEKRRRSNSMGYQKLGELKRSAEIIFDVLCRTSLTIFRLVKRLNQLNRLWEVLYQVLDDWHEYHEYLEDIWRQYKSDPSPRLQQEIEEQEESMDIRPDEYSMFKRNRRYGIDPDDDHSLSLSPDPAATSHSSESGRDELRIRAREEFNSMSESDDNDSDDSSSASESRGDGVGVRDREVFESLSNTDDEDLSTGSVISSRSPNASQVPNEAVGERAAVQTPMPDEDFAPLDLLIGATSTQSSLSHIQPLTSLIKVINSVLSNSCRPDDGSTTAPAAAS